MDNVLLKPSGLKPYCIHTHALDYDVISHAI